MQLYKGDLGGGGGGGYCCWVTMGYKFIFFKSETRTASILKQAPNTQKKVENETLFIMAKCHMRMSGVSPFFKLQNNN